MTEYEVKTAVRYLQRKIKNDLLPPDVVSKNDRPATSKEEALQWLQECLDRGITAI